VISCATDDLFGAAGAIRNNLDATGRRESSQKQVARGVWYRPKAAGLPNATHTFVKRGTQRPTAAPAEARKS